jgi:hypothetical protein
MEISGGALPGVVIRHLTTIEESRTLKEKRNGTKENRLRKHLLHKQKPG